MNLSQWRPVSKFFLFHYFLGKLLDISLKQTMSVPHITVETVFNGMVYYNSLCVLSFTLSLIKSSHSLAF